MASFLASSSFFFVRNGFCYIMLLYCTQIWVKRPFSASPLIKESRNFYCTQMDVWRTTPNIMFHARTLTSLIDLPVVHANLPIRTVSCSPISLWTPQSPPRTLLSSRCSTSPDHHCRCRPPSYPPVPGSTRCRRSSASGCLLMVNNVLSSCWRGRRRWRSSHLEPASEGGAPGGAKRVGAWEDHQFVRGQPFRGRVVAGGVDLACCPRIPSS